MNLSLDSPAWAPEDPRFVQIKHIMLYSDADALLELLQEYKKIAIMALPGMVKDGESQNVCQQTVGRIDFINDFVTLLDELVNPDDPEVTDGG